MIDNVFETIRFEAAQEGLDVIMLNRPDVHSAFNATVIAELTDPFDAIADHCEP